MKKQSAILAFCHQYPVAVNILSRKVENIPTVAYHDSRSFGEIRARV